MKKIYFILLSALLTVLGGCGSSSRTSEAKDQASTLPVETSIQVSTASEQHADTNLLHAQRIEEGKKNLRNNWMNLIHVNQDKYKTGKNKTGIYGLTIRVENTTGYPIDSIKFLVPFYAKGECIQTVYVMGKNIPAEGKISVKVPDNKDATSFHVQVRKVNSAALQLCFDIDDYNREGNDPYKCK